MISNDDTELLQPAKRQRKVSFSTDTTKDPNSCITIRYVSSVREMQSDQPSVPEFSPDFAERFFGEDRRIFGYKNLKVIVWLHALSFHVHIEISHTEPVPPKKGGKGQGPDLLKVFKDIFGAGLIDDRAVFLQLLATFEDSSDLLHRHGRKIAAWSLCEDESWIKVNNDVCDAHNEILLLEDFTDEKLKDWHARLTPLALMFIEAASSVELNDPRWEVYVCLEKASNDFRYSWRIVGFCRVYRFFKYPDSTRLRVSQILVLPPFQGKRNGFHLLEAVYKIAVERDSFEVTMEEPSSDLQELRECMDTVLLLAFDPVRKELQIALSKFKSKVDLIGSTLNFQACMPSRLLVDNVRQNFKICRSQLRSCWQVLLYLHVMSEGENEVTSLFQSLLAWSLKLEVFGNSKSADVGKNKMLIDVENEYDSSRTFVMFKAKPSPGNGGSDVINASELETDNSMEAVDMDQEASAENAFHELLMDRREEIHLIAEKVMQYLKDAGIPLVSLVQM